MTIDQILGSAPRAISREPVTAQIVRVDETGIWAAPLGSDPRTPIGPCRGPAQVTVGETVLLTWTQEQPWIQPSVDTTEFETTTGAAQKVETHRADTTNVHGIANTALLETQAGAQAKANNARDAAIAALLGGIPPSALDTILELAAAYDDNADAIDALVLALAAKETPAGAQDKVDDAIAAHEDTHARFHGDTGVRLVVEAGDVADLPDLEVVARRRGDVVTVFTRESASASHSGATPLYTLPAGFRPNARAAAPVVDQAEAPIAGSVLTVTAGGALQLTASSGDRHYASLTYLTDDTWPNVYPGTAD